MHAHVKKRRYQEHVHAQLQSGHASDANGGWHTIGGCPGLDPKGRQRAEKQAERFASKAR